MDPGGRGGAAANAVFLTGATGFIGGQLLVRLVARRPGSTIYCLVRAKDETETRLRGRATIEQLFARDGDLARAALERVSWVRGDIAAPRFGLDADAHARLVAKTGLIVHSAASTEFDQPYAEAQPINVGGARNAVELARAAHAHHGLERYVHISTAYVAGRNTGRIRPASLPAGGPRAFNNPYEHTKAEAEAVVRAGMSDAPTTIVRPSIVVGDSRTGETSSFNVLYFPIRLGYRGALPFLPVLPRTTLDVVPVDYVCDATLALAARADTAGGTFHLTAAADAMPLHEMVDRIYVIYDRDCERRGVPPIPRTKKVGPWKWWLIGLWLRLTLRGRAREAFLKFALYEAYLLTEKFFEDYETVVALRGSGIERPSWIDYLEKIVEYAVATNWGRREAPVFEGDGAEESRKRALEESIHASGIRILGASGVLSAAELRAASASGGSSGSRDGLRRSSGERPAMSAEARFFATLDDEQKRIARERLRRRQTRPRDVPLPDPQPRSDVAE